MRVNARCFFHVKGLLVALLVLVGAASAPAAPATEQMLRDFGVQLPKEQKMAPDFTLPGLGGGSVSLSDARGKPVLLHFWASWCVPCRHELPLMHAMAEALVTEWGGNRFRMIGVNVDRGDAEHVQHFIDRVVPGFHTLLDPDGVVRSRYAVRALPMTYLIGADGKILGRLMGERDWSSQAARALLHRLIEDAAASTQ